MVKYQATLDDVFSALSDPVRRKIVERLTRGDHTAGELASGFAISQPAISKHIKVLERSGLLKRKVVGREHHLRLAPRAMRGATTWLEAQERFWNQTFDNLEAYLARTSAEEKKDP
jgi:DNA-binding transcriptional ArsR family regulator